jgi:hypothetical protein
MKIHIYKSLSYFSPYIEIIASSYGLNHEVAGFSRDPQSWLCRNQLYIVTTLHIQRNHDVIRRSGSRVGLFVEVITRGVIGLFRLVSHLLHLR